jgi:hypothetical protein
MNDMRIKNFILLSLLLTYSHSGQADSELVIQFDGINDFVDLPDFQDLGYSSPRTVEGWFYPDVIDNSPNTIWGGGTSWPNFLMLFLQDGRLKFQKCHTLLSGTNGCRTIAGPDVLPINTWHHFTFVHDCNTVTIYIDGISVGSLTDTELCREYRDSNIHLGRRASGNHFDGFLDHIRIWDRALAPAEIAIAITETGDTLPASLLSGIRAVYPTSAGSLTSTYNGSALTGGYVSGAGSITYNIPQVDDGQVFNPSDSDSAGDVIGTLSVTNGLNTAISVSIQSGNEAGHFELQGYTLKWASGADPSAAGGQSMNLVLRTEDGRFIKDANVGIEVGAPVDPPVLNQEFIWGDVSFADGAAIADLNITDANNYDITNVSITNAQIDCDVETCYCESAPDQDCRTDLPSDLVKVLEDTETGTWKVHWKDDFRLQTGNHTKIYAVQPIVTPPTIAPSASSAKCGESSVFPQNNVNPEARQTLHFVELTLSMENSAGASTTDTLRVGFYHTEPLPTFSNISGCANQECELTMEQWSLETTVCSDTNLLCTTSQDCNVNETCGAGYPWYKVSDLVDGTISTQEGSVPLGADSEGDALGISVWCSEGNVEGEDCIDGVWQYAESQSDAVQGIWHELQNKVESQSINCPGPNFCIYSSRWLPAFLLPPEAVLRYKYDHGTSEPQEFFTPRPLKLRLWDGTIGNAFEYWTGDGSACRRTGSLTSPETTVFLKPDIYETPYAPTIDPSSILPTPLAFLENDESSSITRVINGSFNDLNLYDTHVLSVTVEPGKEWAVSVSNESITSTPGQSTGSFSFVVEPRANFFGSLDFTVQVTDESLSAFTDEKTITMAIDNVQDDVEWLPYDGRAFRGYYHQDTAFDSDLTYLSLPSVASVPQLSLGNLQTVEMWLKPACDAGSVCWNSVSKPLYTNHDYGLRAERDPGEATGREQVRLCLSNNALYCTATAADNYLWDRGLSDPDPDWIHIAMVLETQGNGDKILRFYKNGNVLQQSVDGQLVDERTVSNITKHPNSNSAAIAGTSGLGGANVWLDEVRVWSTPRPQESLQKHMYERPAADASGLVLNLTFENLNFAGGQYRVNNDASAFSGITASLRECQDSSCTEGVSSTFAERIAPLDDAFSRHAEAESLGHFHFPQSAWFQEGNPGQVLADLTTDEDTDRTVTLHWLDKDFNQSPTIELTQINGTGAELGGILSISSGVFEVQPSLNFVGTVDLKATLSLGNLSLEETFSLDVLQQPDPIDLHNGVPSPSEGFALSSCVFVEDGTTNSCPIDLDTLFYDPDSTEFTIELKDIDGASSAPSWIQIIRDNNADMVFEIEGDAPLSCLDVNESENVDLHLTARDAPETGASVAIRIQVNGTPDEPIVTLIESDFPVPFGGFNPGQPFPSGNTITEDDIDNAGQAIQASLSSFWYDDDDICEPSASTMGVAIYETVRGDWEYKLNTASTWHAITDVTESSALLLGPLDQLRVQPDGQNGIPEGALIKLYLWDGSDGQAGGTFAGVQTRGGGTAFSADRIEMNLDVTELSEAIRLKDDVPGPQDADPALLCDLWVENETALGGTSTHNRCTLDGTTIFEAEEEYTLTIRSSLVAGGSPLAWVTLSEDNSDPNNILSLLSGSGDVSCLALADEGTHPVFLVATDSLDREAVARIDVRITGSNDSPILLSSPLSLEDIDENDTNHEGTALGAFIAEQQAGADDDDCDGTTALGLAITQVDAGQWQYSQGGTADWVDILNVSQAQALLLPAHARIRAKVDGLQGGQAELSGYLWDETGIGAPFSVADVTDSALHGGIRALSVDLLSLQQIIHEVTDPPVLTPNQLTISESADLDTVVGFAVVADDPDNSVLQYAFLNPPVGLPFTMDASDGEVTVSGALDYETTQVYELEVSVQDGNEVVTADFTIEIENENDSEPVIGNCPQGFLINGSENPGEALHAFNVTDPDMSQLEASEGLTFALEGQTAAPPLLELDANRNLILGQDLQTYLAGSNDRFMALSLTVGDGIFSAICNFDVSINQSPLIQPEAFEVTWMVKEGEPIGTVVGIPAVATDPEDDAFSFYAHANGWNNQMHPDLAIASDTGILTTTSIFDYEALPAPFTMIYVFAVDQSSAGPRAGIKVWIQDVNEPPSFTSSSILVPQTADVTMPFDEVPVLDPEGTGLEFIAEEHDTFEIHENGEIFVKYGPQAQGCFGFNDLCRPLYDRVGETFLMNVTATDGEHETATTLLFTVIEVDEPPVVDSPGSDTLAHPLWLDDDSIHFALSAWDPEGEDITWELQQTEASPLASLDTNSLQVNLQEATQGIYAYTLVASDGTETTERNLSLHLFRRDTDGDGLSDILEDSLETLSDTVDTDADGISDFDESGCPAPFRGENIGPTSTAGAFPCTNWYACDVHSQALMDECDSAWDSDDDETINALDSDSDNDGRADADEATDWDGDSDEDGLINYLDEDADDDGILDGADNCWLVANALQIDLDNDQIGDACDADIVLPVDAGQSDAGPGSPIDAGGGTIDLDAGFMPDAGSAFDGGHMIDPVDSGYMLEIPDASAPPNQMGDDDGDGIMDSLDNCPHMENPDQADLDRDGLGDLCDDDMDNDGFENASDNCASVYNPGQQDLDEDTLGDACDTDVDGDGIENAADNCPYVDNANQEDSDSDGIGDACTAAPELVDGGVDIITPDEPEPAPACVCLKTTTTPPLGLAILLLLLALPQLSRRSRS